MDLTFTKIESPAQLREAQAAIAVIALRERAGTTAPQRVANAVEMTRIYEMIRIYDGMGIRE